MRETTGELPELLADTVELNAVENIAGPGLDLNNEAGGNSQKSALSSCSSSQFSRQLRYSRISCSGTFAQIEVRSKSKSQTSPHESCSIVHEEVADFF